jgi:hypothetical protein
MRLTALRLCLLCVVPLLHADPARAQPPVNGYPELARAAEALSKSKLFPRVADGKAPLALQREALADPPVRQALQLLGTALSRPAILSPPPTNVEAPLKDSSASRSLARLLRVRQYVYLADGRVRDAILTARTCLRLGQVAQGETVVTGLTGLAISATGMLSLGEHLEQLSAADCALLSQVCLEWLNQPDPMLRVLEGERRLGKTLLAEQFKQSLQAEAGGTPEERRQAEAAVTQMLARTEKAIDALYARLYEELRKPPWRRSSLEIPRGEGPEAVLTAALIPVLGRLGDVYTREMAQVRLLACHAAVLRFRWEQNRLPSGLPELALGPLAVDPFTGEALQYTVEGPRRYRLTSAGPRAKENDPNAVNGRVPVTVTP